MNTFKFADVVRMNQDYYDEHLAYPKSFYGRVAHPSKDLVVLAKDEYTCTVGTGDGDTIVVPYGALNYMFSQNVEWKF